MTPICIEDSPLMRKARRRSRGAMIISIMLAILSFFYLKVGIIAAILWIGIRLEFWISMLVYGDTINSRRLEILEEKTNTVIDYNLIHD